jgi:hypothetical protein
MQHTIGDGRIVRWLPVAPGNRGVVSRRAASSAAVMEVNHHDERTTETAVGLWVRRP